MLQRGRRSGEATPIHVLGKEQNVPRRGKTKPKEFEFKGFINVDFNDAERVEVNTWLDTFKPDALDSIIVLSEALFKVGFSYVEASGLTHVTITCKDASSPYFGYCFTFKHADCEKGVGVMRYLYDGMLAPESFAIGQNRDKHDW